MPARPDAAPRARLGADARRRQLLDVAARQLDEAGEEGVEIVEVARRAGVSRPVVYRHFPTRQALLQGVLDDFEDELGERFRRAMPSLLGGDLEAIVAAFIGAFSDAIELKGKGAFHLMFAASPDSEAARLGRGALLRIVGPFLPEVSRLTGRSEAEALHLARVLVAAGRASLDGWLDGTLTRDDAARVATRAVTALLVAFSTPA